METVTLRRIHHREKDCIAIFSKPGREAEAAVRNIPGSTFSITHRCWYVEYGPDNLERVLKRLNGIANVDQSQLEPNSGVNGAQNSKNAPGAPSLAASKALQDKLKMQGYSELTLRTYASQFDLFLRFYEYPDPLDLEEKDISNYLLYLVTNRKLSRSAQNQAINAIKFFYEKVARQERRTYYMERPLQERRLPTVLSEEEVVRLLHEASNLKHKLMLMITYSAGLRRSEVLNLKVGDVDPNRGVVFVRGGKGRKDRRSIFGSKMTPLFNKYLEEYQPAYWLFEGEKRSRYSESSFQKIFARALNAAGIKKHASLHTLRHSFATHTLEAGVPTRYIQELLGHTSVKTTELYTQVTRFALDKVRSPLDRLDFPDLLENG